MKSRRFFDRRAGFSLASIGLLLGVVTPSLVPAFASAGTLNTRSIAISNSAKGATDEKYAITFTPSGASWQHLVIDWCTASPVIGATTCTAPSGFDAKTGVTVTGGAAIGTASLNSGASTESHTVIDGTSASTSTSAFTVTLNDVHNPTNAGTFYARMYTYATVDYTAEDDLGTTVDTGAVALSATDEIGVTAYVQEAMTFCVSGVAPTGNCGTLGDTPVVPTSPSLTLGETVGTQKALSTTAISTGDVYAQLSTNASHGATVNLQSDATTCGGLYLNNDTGECHIAPETGASSFTAGNAKFGVKVANSTNADTGTGGVTPSGTFEIATGSGYDVSNYFLNYVSGDATGVTSTYGDPILDTGGSPVNNKNIQLTFGASISNTTPAGKYGAKLRMIATGTF